MHKSRIKRLIGRFLVATVGVTGFIGVTFIVVNIELETLILQQEIKIKPLEKDLGKDYGKNALESLAGLASPNNAPSRIEDLKRFWERFWEDYEKKAQESLTDLDSPNNAPSTIEKIVMIGEWQIYSEKTLDSLKALAELDEKLKTVKILELALIASVVISMLVVIAYYNEEFPFESALRENLPEDYLGKSTH